MLKSTITIHHNRNIENYSKHNSEGYQPKKALTLKPEQIERFINQAPDEIYLLATKVGTRVGTTERVN